MAVLETQDSPINKASTLPASPIKDALILGGLMYIDFVILVINFRAVALANYTVTFISDVILAAMGWTLFKKIQESDHLWSRIAYVLGAGLGSLSSIWLTVRWWGK